MTVSPASSTVEGVAVCRSEEVPEGGRLVLDVGDVTIGLFRVRGELRAYENRCPHQGGPVCQGLVIGAVSELIGPGGETVGRAFDDDDPRIVCPWHGFEFSIDTGRTPAVERLALRSFRADEDDGKVYVAI